MIVQRCRFSDALGREASLNMPSDGTGRPAGNTRANVRYFSEP